MVKVFPAGRRDIRVTAAPTGSKNALCIVVFRCADDAMKQRPFQWAHWPWPP
jgi:hypothetical protein